MGLLQVLQARVQVGEAKEEQDGNYQIHLEWAVRIRPQSQGEIQIADTAANRLTKGSHSQKRSVDVTKRSCYLVP